MTVSITATEQIQQIATIYTLGGQTGTTVKDQVKAATTGINGGVLERVKSS